MTALGVLLGLIFAAGIALLLIASKRPGLLVRMGPLAPGVGPSGGGRGPAVLSDVRKRVTAAAMRSLDSLFGADQAQARLLQAGLDWPVERFRLDQLRWALSGAALAVSIGLIRVIVGHPLPALAWLLFVALGAALGACGAEQQLARRAAQRRERIAREVPTIAEMLAFTVSAGLGPGTAVARVARRSEGELGRELRRCCARVSAGLPLAEAMREVSTRTAVPGVTRLVDAFVVALERGTPLASVLRAQAVDARAAGHRALMESAGRREVLALIPVVFLILPAVVVIAVFPGVYGLTVNVP